MRIYPGQARTIAREVIHELTRSETIEVDGDLLGDAEQDVESILLHYIRTDREINDEVRTTIQDRGLGNNSFSRIKKRLAKERDFCFGDEALDWIVDQTIEMLLHSHNVEEVYGEDNDLRRVIAKVVKIHSADTENELDRAVRGKLKNLEEGSTAWDVEYERALGDIKRKKGLV